MYFLHCLGYTALNFSILKIIWIIIINAICDNYWAVPLISLTRPFEEVGLLDYTAAAVHLYCIGANKTCDKQLFPIPGF